MKHIAAYCLLLCGGNESPSVDQVKSVITAAGGEASEADDEQITKLFADLEGKNIHELLAEGQKKLKTCVSGGGGGGGAAAPAAAGGAAPAAAKEEEKPKEEEVDPMEGGMDMFGGGGGKDY